MDIGKKIKSLRLVNGYSTNRLSKEAGIAQSYLSDIESDKSNPTVEKLSKILKTFNISLADFFAEDKNDTLSPQLKELLNNAKDLTPEQLQKLNEFIKALK